MIEINFWTNWVFAIFLILGGLMLVQFFRLYIKVVTSNNKKELDEEEIECEYYDDLTLEEQLDYNVIMFHLMHRDECNECVQNCKHEKPEKPCTKKYYPYHMATNKAVLDNIRKNLCTSCNCIYCELTRYNNTTE